MLKREPILSGRDLRSQALRRIWRNTRGIASVEFAMILPVMLIIYVGSVDVTRAVMASRKGDLVSRTLSDLVGQQPTTSPTTSATLGTIFSAAKAIMAPFPTSAMSLTVSALDIRAKSDGTCCDVMVRWSYTQGGPLRACKTPLTQVPASTPDTATNFPAPMIPGDSATQAAYAAGQSTYIIVADVHNTYSSIFSQAAHYFSNGMEKTTFTIPREAGQVTLQSPVSPGSGQSGIICF
ncbi:TadE/TadG family type IV pilus assembly protein [Beijerinckia sp. L45]|uniref:TadE/TadG family type IV pilus assembly protein n=1 Tax=Beijerinckia sp. L45 TaxID=1641855 RepID=UPI00131C3955|nr:TadE/TadG family type IV pilus assembly protein [Beijerinckia sp. L45]